MRRLSRFLPLLAALTVLTAGRAEAASVSLHAVFNFDGNLDPAKAILLDAGAWRVGSDVGPLATAAEVLGVLGNVTALEIGGTGTAATSGFATQSFGFILTNPSVGSVASEDFTTPPAAGWNWSAWSSGGGAPGGSIGISDFSLTPTFIAFSAQAPFLGDLSAAFGQHLTFRFAAGDCTGFGLPCSYDFSSGRVILTGDVGLTPVPEPSTLVLVGLGLAAAVYRRWRI